MIWGKCEMCKCMADACCTHANGEIQQQYQCNKIVFSHRIPIKMKSKHMEWEMGWSISETEAVWCPWLQWTGIRWFQGYLFINMNLFDYAKLCYTEILFTHYWNSVDNSLNLVFAFCSLHVIGYIFVLHTWVDLKTNQLNVHFHW